MNRRGWETSSLSFIPALLWLTTSTSNQTQAPALGPSPGPFFWLTAWLIHCSQEAGREQGERLASRNQQVVGALRMQPGQQKKKKKANVWPDRHDHCDKSPWLIFAHKIILLECKTSCKDDRTSCTSECGTRFDYELFSSRIKASFVPCVLICMCLQYASNHFYFLPFLAQI